MFRQGNSLPEPYLSLAHRIGQSSPATPFFSLEFSSLTKRKASVALALDHFRRLGPLFVDVTCHAYHNELELDGLSCALDAAAVAIERSGAEVMLHVICQGMTEQRLRACLDRAKTIGIRNILALQGDKPKEVETLTSDFVYAADLIRFIRDHYGDFFTIACAGGPNFYNKQLELRYLKEKIRAGADFIITQFFFESAIFIEFVEACRQVDIVVPIIPGILPLYSYRALERMLALTGSPSLPDRLASLLEPIRDDDEAVRRLGIKWTIEMGRDILKSSTAYGMHFYTLNKVEATTEIVKALELTSIGQLEL